MSHGSYLNVKKLVCLRALLLCGIIVLAIANQTDARTKPIATSAEPSSYSTQRLQNAVHRLNAWLKGSGQSQRWRQTLMLNILETQSAQGEQADVGTLSQVHARFCSGAMELEQPAFKDVRIALEQQIQQLSASRVGDLFAAVTMARGQYQQISIEELANQRDLARRSLEALKGYWRETIPSRDRAKLSFDLQLDEMIAFLDKIKFELAPENSVGKMSSLIRDVEAQKLEIVRAIDALPFESESDDKVDAMPEKDKDRQEKPEPESAGQQTSQEKEGPTRDELEKQRKELEIRINELKRQRSDLDKLDKLRQIDRRDTFNQLRKFEDNFVKLGESQGDPYFFSAALNFERFVRTYFYGTSDNLQQEFLSKIEALEADLLVIDGPESREVAGRVGDHLRWMENANQVPHLVTAIRARYSLPNMFVSVSGGFLNQLGSQTVNEVQCVRETIDGRLVRGTLNTNASVAIELQDDRNQVHASIHLTGNMSSSTYIDQGKIRAFATTSGLLEGRRSIYANVGGLYAGTPKVAANIQAFFNGTNSPLRLVDKIATNKFNEVKQRTEGMTARRAEDELLKKFGEQTDQALDKGSTALLDAQDKIIPKTNLLPEVYVRSFPSEIMAIGKKSSISSLGAQKMPAGHAMPADVLVRVHDSMPSNFLDKIFSGKTFTNEELAQELGSIVGEAPETLTDKPGAGKDESFSITFAQVRPIQVEFEDSRFRVVVSGRRFSQGDKQITEGLKIILRFKIARIDGQLKFVRDGEAEIDYLEPEKKRPQTVAFRSFLIGKLNPKEGGEELAADLPENLLPIDEVEILQNSEIAKELLLTQCRIEHGWLYLGWNRHQGLDYSGLLFDIPAISNESAMTQPPAEASDPPVAIENPDDSPVAVAQPD